MNDSDSEEEENYLLANRFRTFLPVVVDIETGGFNSQTDAILEISAVILGMDEKGVIDIEQTFFQRVIPFEGLKLEEAALKFTGIDPFHPLRIARPEREVMQTMFDMIRDAVKAKHWQPPLKRSRMLLRICRMLITSLFSVLLMRP